MDEFEEGQEAREIGGKRGRLEVSEREEIGQGSPGRQGNGIGFRGDDVKVMW